MLLLLPITIYSNFLSNIHRLLVCDGGLVRGYYEIVRASHAHRMSALVPTMVGPEDNFQH